MGDLSMSTRAQAEERASRIAVPRGGTPADRVEAETEAPGSSIATRS